eukprot:gene2344-5313_t
MEGSLRMYAGRFSGWQNRYGWIEKGVLFLAPAEEEEPQLHLPLDGTHLIEASSKNITNTFEVISSGDKDLVLQAPNRSDLLQWLQAIHSASHRRTVDIAANSNSGFSPQLSLHERQKSPTNSFNSQLGSSSQSCENRHHWLVSSVVSCRLFCKTCTQFLCTALPCRSVAANYTGTEIVFVLNPNIGYTHWRSGKPPLPCFVCERNFSGIRTKALVCASCGTIAHRSCIEDVSFPCKWTTFETIPLSARFQGTLCHQWSPHFSTAPCAVCSTNIVGMAQLCLWCKVVVHGVCRMALPRTCNLGKHSLSVIRPCDISRTVTRIAEVSPLGQYVVSPPRGANPLIVFVNTKSGSNDGVKILRLMQYFLNPAQIFDLSNGGPAM